MNARYRRIAVKFGSKFLVKTDWYPYLIPLQSCRQIRIHVLRITGKISRVGQFDSLPALSARNDRMPPTMPCKHVSSSQFDACVLRASCQQVGSGWTSRDRTTWHRHLTTRGCRTVMPLITVYRRCRWQQKTRVSVVRSSWSRLLVKEIMSIIITYTVVYVHFAMANGSEITQLGDRSFCVAGWSK